MSETDPTTAGAIGAAIVGAAVAVKEIFTRKRRKTDPPHLPSEPSAASVRIGALAGRIDHLEQEQIRMRHETAMKLDQLAESVDELKTANAATSAILPRIESRLAELRDDLRDRRDSKKKE